MWSRQATNGKKTEPRFLVGTAIGAGAVAIAAERGGADLLLVLTAGHFRMHGGPSIVSMLPIGDANEISLNLAENEIAPVCGIPFFVGLSMMAPNVRLGHLLRRVETLGAAGIINFPTVAHYPDSVQHGLERAGVGFSKELEMMKVAHAMGLGTIAHVTSADQAARMAGAGVDAVCFNFGWNAGGAGGLSANLNLSEAAILASEIRRRVRQENKRSLFMLEGGPIETAEDLTTILEASLADGYIGGSTIDRIPIETSVVDQTMMFKNAVRALKQRQMQTLDLFRTLRRVGLYGSSQAMRKVADRVVGLSQSRGVVVAVGEDGTGRERVLRAVAKARGYKDKDIITLSTEDLTSAQILSRLVGTAAGPGHAGILGRQQGAIILRELEELPRRLQRRLGNYLKDGTFYEIGGKRKCSGAVEIFFCAHAPIPRDEHPSFDPQIQQMLTGKELVMPALRERPEDIGEIISAIMREYTLKNAPAFISPGAARLLRNHTWPGNLTEARNVAEQLMSETGPDNRLSEREIRRVLTNFYDQKEAPVRNERDVILDALWRNGFSRTRTAGFLNISRKTLYNKIRKYGLTDKN